MEPTSPESPPPPTTTHVPLLDIGTKVVKGLFTHHAFDHAATMSFYFFLGMIPLLVFVGLLVGNVVERQGAEDLVAPLYSAMPRVAGDLFRDQLRAIGTSHATSVAPLSLGGFLWLTTNGIHNLMDVFEILIGARARSWWKQRLIATLWLAAVIGSIAAATWLLLGIDGAARELKKLLIPARFRLTGDSLARDWQGFGVLLIFTAIVSLSLAGFYRIAVVHPKGVRRHMWPGTFVALLLWTLVSWGFSRYVVTIGHYAVYYGSLATVAVILLWLYLTSLALVVGAEVNAQLEGVREPMAVL